MVERRVRKQVTGELFQRELIKLFVGVERVDDPLAIRPDFAEVVEVNAVRVGIAGRVQPVSAAVLTPGRRLHQAVHIFFVPVRGRVVGGGIRLLDRRRQTGEVQAQPANQCPAVGHRGRRKLRLVQFGEDEAINRTLHPGVVGHLRHCRAGRRNERPVRLILGALGDPADQQLLLGRLHHLVRLRRRHQFARLGREHAFDRQAFLRVARGDCPRLDRSVPLVQTQVGLAGGTVGTMAGEAVFGEDRTDIAVELQFLGASRRNGGQRTHDEGEILHQ